MEREQRDFLLGNLTRGVVDGLIVRKPASGLTATYDGGVVRVGSGVATQPVKELVIASSTIAITASKDGYIYITSAGTVTKIEVANGAAKPKQADIGADSEFLALAVTSGTDITSVTDLRRLASHGDIKHLIVPISFETGEQADNGIVVEFNGRILEIQSEVTKAIAATDAGTCTPAIGVNEVYTNVTGGLLTFPLSTALNTRIEAIPTAANVFKKGNRIKFPTAKTTAGGKALLTVICEAQR